MRIVIHRGARQIGGCCTEIRTDRARVFIDLGRELPEPGKTPRPLEIDGLTRGKPRCHGVFFTHYHGDHMGLYGDVLPGIPLYMGQAAKEIFQVFQTHLSAVDAETRGNLPKIEAIRTFEPAKPVTVGDIKITPFFTDHSAYDAYMFLIEAEGKRILHTGDFRTHGYLGKGVLPVLKRYVGRVDVLITEGTTLSREQEEPESEYQLQMKLKEYVQQYKNVFLLCSSTHIDRLAGFYAAARECRRPFVCDSYQKAVLDVVTRRAGEKSALYRFDRVYSLPAGEKLTAYMEKAGFCMPIRANEKYLPTLNRFSGEDSILLYSMWKGYLDQSPAVSHFVAGRRWEYLHTSGHASPNQIKAVCDTVKPRLGVIPIHTGAPHNMKMLCGDCAVLCLKDKISYEL